MKKYLLICIFSLLAQSVNADIFYANAQPNFLISPISGSYTLSGTWSFGSTTTAGTGITKIDGVLGGASATDNLVNITTTFPATMTAITNVLNIQATGNGSSSFNPSPIRTDLLAGYTGSSATYGGVFGNASAGTQSSIANGNMGVRGDATGAGAGTNVGISSDARNSTTTNAGIVGRAIVNSATAGNYGVVALARNTSGGAQVGLFVNMVSASTVPSASSTAAHISNGAEAIPILTLQDNTTTVFQVADGGLVTNSPLALTAGTMTAETAGGYRTSTHSYTWTNAQVVALGAALTGDITVATLPAKTVVENAYVVITGTGAGTASLTVACGRTGAGYIDYIVASDAQAAANTVYGGAGAERGTNLTGYDLPSYTATTDVKCHFISTVQNLDQVTGSTGRVILRTSLVP